MNKYFALRKANRMRTKMLTEKSQEQLKEVIAYLRSVTFDICGVEVVQSDLIDIAMRANEEGCELFQFITDAETFVNEVKPSMKPLRWPDFLIFEISVLCFWGYGVASLVMTPSILAVVPDFKIDVTLASLLQLCICVLGFYYLYRSAMEKVGFPPRKHQVKAVAFTVLYILVLYEIGKLLRLALGSIVFIRIPVWPYTIANLLIGAAFLWLRFDRYGKRCPVGRTGVKASRHRGIWSNLKTTTEKAAPPRWRFQRCGAAVLFFGGARGFSPCRRSRTARSSPCTCR